MCFSYACVVLMVNLVFHCLGDLCVCFFFVQSVAVQNAVFCVICSFCNCVSDVPGFQTGSTYVCMVQFIMYSGRLGTFM